MRYKEETFTRKVLGFPVTVTEMKDGVQRSQSIKDGAGIDIGVIWTGRHTDQVNARLPNGESKRHIAMKHCMTKDQAFTALRRWIVAETFKLPEGENA